ncbi:hypothetical protein AB0M28_31145 [Streptomyces sp. NPDC051940]|uniref:hypothetical protein n=1 Tax=Streptomyces sp. NPDC051940 TaxID=3155675 RepID=UPI003428138C
MSSMGRRILTARGHQALRWGLVFLVALTVAAFAVPVVLSLLPQSWVGGWSDAAYSRITLAVAAAGCVVLAYWTRRGRAGR